LKCCHAFAGGWLSFDLDLEFSFVMNPTSLRTLWDSIKRFAWKNRSFAILWTPVRFPAAKDSHIVAVGNQTSSLSVTALTRLITKVPATIWDHSSWLCPNPPIKNSPKDIFIVRIRFKARFLASFVTRDNWRKLYGEIALKTNIQVN